MPNRSWDVHRWLTALRRSKGGSREAFWRLWGLTNFLTCSTCDAHFPVCELEQCAYHPSEPIFERGDARGHYPCCGQPATRFESAADARRHGCLFRRHTPVTRAPAGSTNAAAAAAARSAARIVEIAISQSEHVLAPADEATTAAGWAAAPPALSRDGSGTGSKGWKAASAAALAAAAAATAGGADDDDDIDELHRLAAALATASESSRQTKSRPVSAKRRARRGSSSHGAVAHADRDRDEPNHSQPHHPHSQPLHSTSRRPSAIEDDVYTTAGGAQGGYRSASDASFSDSDSSAGSASGSDSDTDISARGRAPSGGARRDGADKGSRGRGGSGGRGWMGATESLMIEDECAMNAMSVALEGLRREGAPPERPPALLSPKAFFLDRRQIMHIQRSGGVAVLWPRSAAAAARRY